FFFFFSSRRRHTRSTRDWSSDVCSSDLTRVAEMSRRARELAPSFSMQKELQLFTQIVEAAWTGRRNTKHVAKDAGLGDRGSVVRSEERRVGKEWRGGGWWYGVCRKGGEW